MDETTNSVTPPPVHPSMFWRLMKLLLLIAPVLGLASVNVLTLVNDQAHAAGVGFLKAILAPALAEDSISRLLSQSPSHKYQSLEKSHKALEIKSTVRSQAVKRVSIRVARRAAINAGKNVASYAAEIVPIVGVAAITALTISDLYDDCQTLKDINELSVIFELEATDEATICGIKLP